MGTRISPIAGKTGGAKSLKKPRAGTATPVALPNHDKADCNLLFIEGNRSRVFLNRVEAFNIARRLLLPFRPYVIKAQGKSSIGICWIPDRVSRLFPDAFT